MIGKLILTQGGLAGELLGAARTISGEVAGIEALSLDWSDNFEEAKSKIRSVLDRLDEGQGVLILTDIFGSTPTNVALTFHQPGKVEILTGVNLPMVLRLTCPGIEESEVAVLARWLLAKAQRSVGLASEMTAPTPALPCPEPK